VISVTEQEAGPLSGLSLPEHTKVLYGYRKDELLLADGDTTLKAGDDLVLLTTSQHLQELQERGAKESD
jgi:trk system potassium uptake protein TrkA